MFLRSLSLRGFKSFADRTTLEFTPGISVIVGPNGSGKSNLVDAISWVLGEQGPRALRGGQMADVIFAGSPARPALGLAEVKLVIDNSAGLIPVPLSEIEISRAIFRSGESEYRIGGEVCRLLDIQDLLAETGIGRALHTVVGQGQLEDVLTARPEERRQYIEEAAGIAKHRRRKERAQRKLASLEQDLLRLQDVLAELRRQLRPLKQQAEVAKRHEQLSAEAEELAWRLAAARLRDLMARRDSRSGAWEEGVALREAARARLEEVDAELARLGEERTQTATALRRAEEAQQSAQETRSEAERRLREAVDRLSQARSRVAKRAAAAARLAILDEELGRVEAARRDAAEALSDRELELDEEEAGFRHREAARRHAEEERRRMSEEAVARRAEMDALGRSLASSERERDRLESAMAEVRERLAAAQAERESLEREVERLDAEETPLAEMRASLDRDRQILAVEVADLEERARKLEHRRALLEARRRDVEETPGSRFLQAHPGRAVGLLGSLVRAEPGLERALVAALGGLADAVVYAERERALADAPDGDGAALGVSGGVAPPRALPGERALIDEVHPDPRARDLVPLILRDVYLAADVEEAERKQRANPGCSFVTPDGVMVGPEIIRTAHETDARAEAIRRELQAVDRDLAVARSSLRPRAERLREVLDRMEADRAELDRADAAITRAADRMARLSSDADSFAREEALLAERLAGLEDAAAGWRERLAEPAVGPAEPPGVPPAAEPPMALRVEVETLRRECRRLDDQLARLRREREGLAEAGGEPAEAAVPDAEAAREAAEAALAEAEAGLAKATSRRDEAAEDDRRVGEAESQANRTWRGAAAELERLREAYEQQDRARADLDRRIVDAERLLMEGHERSPQEALAALDPDDAPGDLERRAELVSRRLALLGRVNLLAEGEFQSLQERHAFLARELDDVRAARRDLVEVIRRVDEEIVTRFDSAFHDVAAEFARLFSEVFPGGEGRLTITDPADPLAAGVEIEARPGRKRVKRISLLSGGERALAALAFLFAIFRARPSPFYLLDEVEAALDDVNLHRFLALVKGFAETSQVLVVTHQKRTMEAADVLYGVSMGQDGASRVVSQRLEHSEAAPRVGGVVVVPEASDVH